MQLVNKPSRDSTSTKKVLPSTATKSKPKLANLLISAMAIPGLAGSFNAFSQTAAPDSSEFRLFYGDYREKQEGGEDRMRILTPTAWLLTPISQRTSLEAAFTLDAMSGASPYYLSTLSGASGSGIRDRREAGDVKLTHYFDDYSLGAGVAYSTEDDYDSVSTLLEAKLWSDDKNTTFAAGVSFDDDSIGSTNNPDLDESSRAGHFFAGVTQVLTQDAVMQSNITFTNSDGYLSDPYKYLDNRPSSRDEFAWLTRYNLYFNDFDAALHTDYRLFVDSWGVVGHTVEVAWYQPIGSDWMLRPHIRYHSQNGADFFQSTFPPAVENAFYSADQRMADMGGVTTGVKVTKELGDNLSIDVGYSYLQQQSNFKAGGQDETNIKPFSAQWFTFGLLKRW